MTDVIINDITARTVLAPFNIAPASASGSLSHAALVLIDVDTSAGVTGRTYIFAYGTAMLKPLQATVHCMAEMVKGRGLSPLSLEAHLRASLKLVDTPGLVGLALSGLDMAFWDAHCKVLQQPLARVLGSDVQSIQAYNSCGLWIQDVDALADEAEQLLAMHDFNAVKLRLGRPDAGLDLQAVEKVKSRLGDTVDLMVDFNQSQSVNSAIKRSRMIDDAGLYWIEEPVRHGDYAGTAAVRNAIKTPVQTGENLDSNFALKMALDAAAADYYMPDVQRIGGVSGWLRAAAQCHAAEVEMSSHLFPEISAHLLAVTPTCHWLEYVDWANPILQHPLQIKNGRAMISEQPGIGIEWDESAVSRYLV